MRSPEKIRIRSSSADRKKRERPGVALASRAAAQLVVDAPALVALGAHDVEAAGLGDALAQLDVDATAGHVRRDRDRARLAGAEDDLGLPGVVLGVEDVVGHAASGEHPREHLGDLDRDRADQDRLARLVGLAMSSTTARNLASLVLKMKSFSSTRTIGRLVGIEVTSVS